MSTAESAIALLEARRDALRSELDAIAGAIDGLHDAALVGPARRRTAHGVLLRHRLLAQPGGFEGLLRVEKRSGRLDKEDRTGRLVGDRVGNASENPAMHALVADHQRVRLALLGQPHQDIGRVALAK